jgi:shikimate dehydrogenase
MAPGSAGRRLAVLGHPVAHSRSPAMQNAALRELGLDGWSYEAIDVAPDGFAGLVVSMAEGDFAGANVTVPHKGGALAVAEEFSEVAREVGAANTLAFEQGVVRAYNTDAAGLLAALPAAPDGQRALVLGAGGAARAVVWALVREGGEVDVWNRTPLRSSNLCEELGGHPVSDPSAGEYDLIVNSTAVGLGGEDPFAELPIGRGDLREGQTVVDLPYGIEPTALVDAAREAGAAVVDGIEVLVRQGAESLRIWTGREPPLEVMRDAARSG